MTLTPPPLVPPAAGSLIDWLLTVPVEQRATVEDVAHHWWLNLGAKHSVCDCPWPRPHQDGHTPSSAPLLPAACINWQSDEAAAAAAGGASSLRKSRKENAVPQSAAPPGAADRKKPKGILKPQRSFDPLFLPCHSTAPQPRATLVHAPHVHAATAPSSSPPPPSAFSQPSSKMPKKGILKTQCGGDLGSGGHTDDTACPHQQSPHYPAAPEDGAPGPPASEAMRRRKGILKRNGKFSRRLDLPPAAAAAALPEVLQPPGGTAQSRPSSAVSEDSLFSCDSFEILDLSVQTRRRLFSHRRQQSVCSSEDEPELLGEGWG